MQPTSKERGNQMPLGAPSHFDQFEAYMKSNEAQIFTGDLGNRMNQSQLNESVDDPKQRLHHQLLDMQHTLHTHGIPQIGDLFKCSDQDVQDTLNSL